MMHVFATKAANGIRGGFAFSFDAGGSRQIVVALANQLTGIGVQMNEDIAVAVANTLAGGHPIWAVVDHDGAVAISNEAPAADMMEMPWGIFLGQTEDSIVRYQLFDDDEHVTAPPQFRTESEWNIWVDEAARRTGGMEQLNGLVQANDILKERIRNATGGIENDQGRQNALDSVFFRQAARVGVGEDEPSSRTGGRGGSLGDESGSDTGRTAVAGRGSAEGQRSGEGNDVRRDEIREDRSRSSVRTGEDNDVAAGGGVENNFRIEGALGTGRGAKTRARANMDAIECLLQIGDEQATPEQQEILAEYVGWGGLPQIFDERQEGWENDRNRLRSLTSEAEYEAMRDSTLNAHYTSIPVVKAMWQTLATAGYDGKGEVIEPSCGIGHFIGGGPADQQVTAVELDSFTAKIATKLYPGANVVESGFQDFDAGFVPEYDVAIGNPPFGTDRVYDSHHKDLSHHTIHNYFLAKSMRSIRPGGLAAFVVSRYFLDSGNPKTRQMIHQMADLVAAVRLPDTAFERNAGTSVVSDVLVFRKRLPHEHVPEPDKVDWLHADKQWDDRTETAHNINRFITANPAFLVGAPSYDGKMFRGSCYTVRTDIPADDQEGVGAELARKLQYQVLGRQREHGKMLYEPFRDPAFDRDVESDIPSMADLKPTLQQRKTGGLIVHDDGHIYAIKANPDTLRMDLVTRVVPRGVTEDARLRALLAIRDKTRELLDLETDSRTDIVKMTSVRNSLREDVEDFVTKFTGPYNGANNSRILVDEPDRHLILSLHDAETETHAALLERRCNKRPRVLSEPKTIHDAVAMSFAERGSMDVEFMGDAMDRPVEEIERELIYAELAYKNPETGEAIWQDDYLSGNVRKKLAEAKAAAVTDSSFERNVIGLEEVVPLDIPAEDIYAQIESPWLPAEELAEFFMEHTGINIDCVRYGSAKILKAVSKTYQPSLSMQMVRMRQNFEHGTERMNAVTLFNHLANGQEIAVHDYIHEDGKRKSVLNIEETEKAKMKADEMKAGFGEWVWKDSDRAKRLAESYNDVMNAHVPRKYDGSVLTLDGMADSGVTLRRNQRDAAFRMVCTERTLVDHSVGAGKTFTAIAGEMEKQRMGLTSKSMFVVPNHLVGQWAQEFQRLYPGSAVLTMEPGTFGKPQRKAFLARIATGDWNAIICPHSTFGMIDVSREFQVELKNKELAEIDKTIEDIENLQAQDSGNVAVQSLTVKQQVRARKKAMADIAELQSKPHNEDLLTWEQLGIDSLVVDEVQAFKNLRYVSSYRNLAGLGPDRGSKKAYDLFSKIRWMDDQDEKTTVTFLTGTPITNTVSELFHMMNYLAPDDLRSRGTESMDLWLRTFAEISSGYETTVTGMGFKRKTRVRAFHNVPELATMYAQFADVITNEDLDREHLKETGKNWPIPRLAGDESKKVILSKSSKLEHVFDEIVERMETIDRGGVDPKDDNVLLCLHDARTNALDMRIQAEEPVPYDDQCKIEAVARELVRIHDKWDDAKGVQLVFCDLSTPKQFRKEEAKHIEQLSVKAEQGDTDAINMLASIGQQGQQGDFDVYNELRRRVIEISEGRVKAEDFAFIHESGSSMSKRERMFDQVRKGDIRILMGSSSKMGTGMNVQNRLVALHHMDVPWRPADLEQREGRILRQGNELYDDDPEGFEVEVVRYATVATSDTKFWQTLETKARFIEQFRKGTCGAAERQMDDIGDTVLSYAQMKALSADNPLILEELELEVEVRSLEREKRSHAIAVRRYEEMAEKLKNHESETRRTIGGMQMAMTMFEQSPPKMTLQDGTSLELPMDKEEQETASDFEKRRSVVRDQMVKVFARLHLDQLTDRSYTPKVGKCDYKGFTVEFEAKGPPASPGSGLWRRHVGVCVLSPDGRELEKIGYATPESFSASGFMQRFENLFKRELPARKQAHEDSIPKNAAALEESLVRRNEEFPKNAELEAKRERLTEVRMELAKDRTKDRDNNQSRSAARAA